MSAARIGMVALAIAASGCRIHLDHNAPGHIDVQTPPEKPEAGKMEVPEDPGERVLLVAAGPFAGAGGRIDDGLELAAEVGIELGIDLGEREKSHHKPMLFPLPAIPEKRQGIHFGLVIIEPDPENTDQVELGPLYVEYQRSEILAGWALGYSYDAGDNSHGPMATVSFAGLYLRAGYRIGRGPAVVLGAAFKFPVSIIWSR